MHQGHESLPQHHKVYTDGKMSQKSVEGDFALTGSERTCIMKCSVQADTDKESFMARKKIYAVRKGNRTGLFASWEDCAAAVKGFPGAEYRGFQTAEEAESWLALKCSENSLSGGHKQDPERDAAVEILTAYVDGSFEEDLGKYSFGCILLTPEGELVERCGSGKEPESLAIRNVAGEMLGAMYAVQWGINKGYKAIELHYDYMGIEKWATGAWKTNHPLTQKYAEFMKGRQKFIAITFCKVKAHSGDRYNEQADQLAKKALAETEGIPEIK